eukprot:1342311-Rhodomonas_salina.1
MSGLAGRHTSTPRTPCSRRHCAASRRAPAIAHAQHTCTPKSNPTLHQDWFFSPLISECSGLTWGGELGMRRSDVVQELGRTPLPCARAQRWRGMEWSSR